MPYLRNAWYVAAWGSEIALDKPFARTLLDVPMVLFRDSGGRPHALRDRCPHRFAPLSMGRITDGAVECGYHGLRFDGAGHCVFNPQGDGKIPNGAKVASWPLVERHAAIWIWMGDPERADPDLIPDFYCLDPDQWAIGTGHIEVAGPYDLETDNIMDLSHIEFMHPLFSSDAVRRGQTECTQDGRTVWSKRVMNDDANAPDFVCQAFDLPPGSVIDRFLEVRWDAPATMLLLAGGGPPGCAREDARISPSAHIFTPETETRTHYFFATAFPRALGPIAEELAQSLREELKGPFELEDKPMIEAVARNMHDEDFWSLRPVLLPGDAAAVRARRILDQMIRHEQAEPVTKAL